MKTARQLKDEAYIAIRTLIESGPWTDDDWEVAEELGLVDVAGGEEWHRLVGDREARARLAEKRRRIPTPRG